MTAEAHSGEGSNTGLSVLHDPFFAVCLWNIYCTSLGCNFLTCKMGCTPCTLQDCDNNLLRRGRKICLHIALPQLSIPKTAIEGLINHLH